MLRLSAIYRYPLKSGMGERLARSELDALGLLGDRRWMLIDADSGRFLSQRLLPQMALLQARWVDADCLQLDAPGMPSQRVWLPDADTALRDTQLWGSELSVPDAGDAAAAWLEQWLGRRCRLLYQPSARARQVNPKYATIGERTAFTDGYPLLLIGQSSLEELSAQVGRPLEMLRFRPNLVIEGAAPYAEDGWKRIRIGAVELRLVKPCSRCIITTVDPNSGERDADREPLETLKRHRLRDGEVYFGQNLLHPGHGVLEEGAPVEILE